MIRLFRKILGVEFLIGEEILGEIEARDSDDVVLRDVVESGGAWVWGKKGEIGKVLEGLNRLTDRRGGFWKREKE